MPDRTKMSTTGCGLPEFSENDKFPLFSCCTSRIGCKNPHKLIDFDSEPVENSVENVDYPLVQSFKIILLKLLKYAQKEKK